MPVIPSESTAIIYAICGIIAIIGLFLAKSFLTPWLQKYQNSQDQKALDALKTQIVQDNTKENSESDALKKIEETADENNR